MVLLIGYGANASGLILHDGYSGDKSVQAFDGLTSAMSFFLCAKASRLLSNVVYAVVLPRFRKAHLTYALANVVMVCPTSIGISQYANEVIWRLPSISLYYLQRTFRLSGHCLHSASRSM